MTTDEAVQVLSQSADHRLLRRVPPVSEWRLAEASGDVVRGVVLDTETTGLEDTDEIVELAIVPFDYDKATGKVVRVDTASALSAFRQPSVPMNEEARHVTGITDEMLAGQSIAAERVAAALAGAQVVISHHAGFDRPMCERLFPELFEPLCWACSYAEIDWRGEGIGSSKLDYLLMRFGMFHEGHRAMDDALALLYILAGNLPTSCKSALGSLLEQARKPLFQVRAEWTLIGEKDLLRARGYSWDPGGKGATKAWVAAVSDAEAEVAWLKQSPAFTKASRVVTRQLSPRVRYSARSRAA
jgi:DNA polymerase III subunit epsilon